MPGTCTLATTCGRNSIIDAARAGALDAAAKDAAVLRVGLGPIVPVRAQGVELLLKAFGEPFPLEFDLNAVTAAELAALPALDAAARARVLEELEKQPFASLHDFETRTGLTSASAGLEAVKRQ